MSYEDEIRGFIERFNGAKDTFLHGCCYWFARILYERFKDRGIQERCCSFILYEPVEGHFLFGVCRWDVWMSRVRHDVKAGEELKVYDVRGDVTELYKGKELYTMRYLRDEMEEYYDNLMRDCRDFLPEGEDG